MPRLTLKTTFVALVSAIALLQLVAVTLAALPPNRYSDATTSQTSYLRPMFTQNWRLFAPNPVSDDRMIRFQGSYVTADGAQEQTEWLDWTEVELDLVRHKLVGGRAGYVTNKLFGPLGARYGGLLPEQENVAAATTEKDPPSWAELSKQLVAAGPSKPVSVSLYLRYDRAATRLGTEVLKARWPDRTFTAVRYSLVRHRVTPYEARHGTDKEREAARGGEEVRVGGWRVPEVGSAAEQRSVADFYRRHR